MNSSYSFSSNATENSAFYNTQPVMQISTDGHKVLDVDGWDDTIFFQDEQIEQRFADAMNGNYVDSDQYSDYDDDADDADDDDADDADDAADAINYNDLPAEILPPLRALHQFMRNSGVKAAWYLFERSWFCRSQSLQELAVKVILSGKATELDVVAPDFREHLEDLLCQQLY